MKNFGLSILLVLAIVSCVQAGEAEKMLEASGVQGGVVVVVGCDDPQLIMGLRANDRYIVQALDADVAEVEAARKLIRSKGVYGKVTALTFDGKNLPYVDNCVNAIVIQDAGCKIRAEEIDRVLAPRGVAVAGKTSSLPTPHSPLSEEWSLYKKPVPQSIDDWTHFLHGPGNNAVARDTVVGPPERLQWIADPIHLRSHEHLNSISALVSTGGRIFYIIDEGPTQAVIAEPQWRLVARDAFNGLLLWKRDLGPWEGHFRVFRSGPAEIARRLVAVGDSVYVTLGYGGKVASFDAATGAKQRVYDAANGALEIICSGGKLFVLTGSIDMTPDSDPGKRYKATPHARKKGIVVFDASSGRKLWSREDKDTSEIMPATLAVFGGLVFFQNTKQIICLDELNGKEKWRFNRALFTKRLSWSSPVLVVSKGIVLSAEGSTGGIRDVTKGGSRVEWIMSDQDIRKHPEGDVIAIDAKTGKKLWAGRSLQGFCNPGDVFVIGDSAWIGANVASKQMLLNIAVDLKTGKLKSSTNASSLPMGGHARCYRDKATVKYLVLGGTGIEFIDIRDWKWNGNNWLRGTCQYGVMPCNGLIYAPSDSCACRPEMRHYGFSAMAAGGSTPEPVRERLVKGPAYDDPGASASASQPIAETWPTYRSTGDRSGSTAAMVKGSLKTLWRSKLGGKLSSITVADGRLYVSRVDAHTVHALDVGTGKTLWSKTVGGPVDSPPSIHNGMAIFGCRDGSVYCLRACDGKLVWKFSANPGGRKLVAMESLEAVMPVHGSVLVKDGLVWFAAGRSPYLDGGTRLYALKAGTGQVVVDKQFDALGLQEFSASKSKGKAKSAPVQPDVLSASDDLIFMRMKAFELNGNITAESKPRIFSATGFLDDTWWHRTYWQYGSSMGGGFGGWPSAAQRVPAGRLIVAGKDKLFVYGRSRYDAGNGGNVHAGHIGLVKRNYMDEGRVNHSANPYRLYCASKSVKNVVGRKGKNAPQPVVNRKWSVRVPVIVRGMVLAGDRLFIAGPNEGKENKGLINLGLQQKAVICSVDTQEGKTATECEIPATPVLDGMAAIPGRLLISCIDGSVVCVGGDS